MDYKWLLLLVPAAALMAGDEATLPPSAPAPAWASKAAAQWSEDDAKDVLNDSPWVKTVTPTITRNTQSNNGPFNRNNVGFGMPGMGFPGGGGGGMGRRGGMGRPPSQQQSTNDDYNRTPPKLTVRWESALPIREAELKAKDVNAPTLEDEKHYALAVYGLPANIANDPKKYADKAKGKAFLKRDGKKDIKASSVQVLRREDGPVVLFLFPETNEISKNDRRVEFDAQIDKLDLTQSFYLEEMTYQGKTEL